MDIIDYFKSNAKPHSIVNDKNFILLYVEFKQYFVVMNQKARQKTTSPVERDF